MRWIATIAVLLIAATWLACHVDPIDASAANQYVPAQWRRTTGGWERIITTPRLVRESYVAPHPHPLVFTLFVGMLSAFSLVAFSPNEHSSAD